MMRKSFSTLCFFLFLTTPVSAAWGAEILAPATKILVRTGEHASYDRIVFDAPEGAHYVLKRDAETVTLSFSVPARLKIGAWQLPRARDFKIVSGAQDNENLVVSFVVSPAANIKDFMSDKSIVIDVSGPDVPLEQRARIEDKEVKKQDEPKAPKEPVIPAPLPKEELPSPPVKKVDLAPTPKAAPVSEVEEMGALVSPEMIQKPLSSPLAPEEAKRLLEIAQATEAMPVASFEPNIPVGAAIFKRGGYAIILFDKKFAQSIIKETPQPRVKVEDLSLTNGTGYRIALPEGVDVRATKNGEVWDIYLVSSEKAPSVSTEFITQPDFALGARVLLSTANPSAPILFEDPVVGDKLIAIPFLEAGAFTLARRLADFEIIPSAQGLVIKPWHEKIVVRTVPDGIEITAEGGLKLSPSRDTGAFDNKVNMKRIFDFQKWRGREGETFTQTRQKLMQTIIDVPEKEKLLARMDLARFYFANGMAVESLSLLTLIQEGLPEIERQPDFLSLRGASRILVGYIEEGLADFTQESLSNQIETVLWQAVGAAKMQEWPLAFERFKKTLGALADYPEPFRSRIQILAVETALAVGEKDEAEKWLSEIEKAPHDSEIEPALKYMRGVLYVFSKHLDLAGDLWREVMKGKDRLYKIRAELALVDLGVATKSLTPKQAIERLEGLRFAWRGDDLELDILRRLGMFYIDAKEFKAGLSVLSKAVRLFPGGAPMKALKTQMVRTFTSIFLTDIGAGLTPLESLSLYTEFAYLVPAGEAGNEIRIKLAEKLVNIDLLDQAALLFEEIIKNSSSPEEKAKTAKRLAGVRLLDHRAEDALKVLDMSELDASESSQAVRLERQLLRARALSELGKYDESLAILPAEAGEPAKLLRADIAMRAKQWPDAVKALLELIGPPPKLGQKVSSEQAGWLISAAMAMAQSGDLEGLDKLAEEYSQALDGSSKADMFRVLTRPEKLTQFKDLAAAQEKLTEVDMFQGFLNSYRKDDKVEK